MWCHMGQFHDTLHLPQTSLSNLRKGCKSDGSRTSMLESSLSLFVCFLLQHFCVACGCKNSTIAIVQLVYHYFSSFFCLFPSSVTCFLVQSFHHRCQKCQSSLSLQCWDKPRGFKNNIALGLFVFGQQQTQNALPSHEI